MSSNKKYWKSVEELDTSSPIVDKLKQNEFVEPIPVNGEVTAKKGLAESNTSRRDFLKYIGFSTAAASMAACEGPVVKSIPYVVQPEQIVPGNANYYATSIANGFDFAPILVKTREGRPVKIDKNDLSGKGVNARVHASILDLYDSLRLQGPEKEGTNLSWGFLDSQVKAGLAAAQNGGKQIAIVTPTYASPSTSKLIGEFVEKHQNVKHIIYDAVSEFEATEAFKIKYGRNALLNYQFDQADVIVSVGADILGDWQGGGYESGYAKGRVPKNGKMSKHYQFESNMTLSGANADHRIPVTANQQKAVLAKLAGYIMGKATQVEINTKLDAYVRDVATQIQKAGNKAVVVSGISDIHAQTVVLEINQYLSSKAANTTKTKQTRQGNPAQMNQLIQDMNAGKVGMIIIDGVNPVYSLANGDEFANGIKNTDFSVYFTMKNNETAAHCHYLAAKPHYLESWGDVALNNEEYSLMQPTIRPLFDTRQFQDALLKWNGNDSQTYYQYLRKNWEENVLEGVSFNKALQDGICKGKAASEIDELVSNEIGTSEEIPNTNALTTLTKGVSSENGYTVELYTTTALGDGQQANNPWLQELPDPITRATWDNYVTISQLDATKLGVINEHEANGALNGSYVEFSVEGKTITAPAIIQPGQAPGTLGLALGYGKTKGLKKDMQTGVNAYSLYINSNKTQNVSQLKALNKMHEFACIQLQNTLMGRGDIVRETTLEIFNTKDKKHWNAVPVVSLNHEETPVTDPNVDLWTSFDRTIGHYFNLSIDLNSCTGCGACVIACQSENNVPVVGKSEMRRSRDMHWLRIDRYYSSNSTFAQDVEQKENTNGLGLFDYMFGDRNGDGSLSSFGRLENASSNPQVVFQPIMCQHCNHAPCETVCPVAATSHGRQGQNQMAYNRCVGTRYCANNCPYKVRRFNWFLYAENDEFDFNMNNDLGRMALNPDVVVRSRGVMEKCSFCIQKTQKTILDAKREGRAIKDGEFQTACSAACSTGAMVFGDINDEESQVAEMKNDDRTYYLLESVGTKPNVFYQTKVRNTSSKEEV